MKKRFKIPLIVVSSLVFLVGCFALGVYLNGTCFDGYVEAPSEYQSWMNYIEDDTKLNEIAIPGSHDAGTHSICWLGETQNLTIKQQLDSGFRYFDIRVNKRGENSFVIYHDMFDGPNFINILSDIKTFVVSNPSETLLLDFQHFKGDSSLDVKNLLYENLYEDGLLVENLSAEEDLDYISSLTLSEVRGKCIAFFGDNSSCVSESYIFKRNNDDCSLLKTSLNSCYIASYNKMNSMSYITNGLPFYIEQIKSKIANEGNKGIFVLQGQLTDGALIFGPWSKEKKHSANMNNYTKSLEESIDLEIINVIMRDFCNSTKAKIVISLNKAKSLVKPSLLDEFSSFFA